MIMIHLSLYYSGHYKSRSVTGHFLFVSNFHAKKMKRILDDIIDLISPVKRFHRNVTCLLDLSNEILIIICRYLSLYDILHCFYTPERPDMRLHRLISDYYTKINLVSGTFNESNYLIKLFNDSTNPLRPESLRLSNENISCLIQHYFSCISRENIQSIFVNLINLSLIDCLPDHIYKIDYHYKHFTKLESLHVNLHKYDEDLSRKKVTSSKQRLSKTSLCFADDQYHLIQ